MNELLYIFCTRICHDLLGPVGALQLSFDCWKQGHSDHSRKLTENHEDILGLEDSMKRLISELDIIRKAYGFGSDSVNEQQLIGIMKEIFPTLLLSEEEGNDKKARDSGKIVRMNVISTPKQSLCPHALRFLSWLRNKMLADTVIDVEMGNDFFSITVDNVYLVDEEKVIFDHLKNREEALQADTVNSYTILLYIFYSKVLDCFSEFNVDFSEVDKKLHVFCKII